MPFPRNIFSTRYVTLRTREEGIAAARWCIRASEYSHAAHLQPYLGRVSAEPIPEGAEAGDKLWYISAGIADKSPRMGILLCRYLVVAIRIGGLRDAPSWEFRYLRRADHPSTTPSRKSG